MYAHIDENGEEFVYDYDDSKHIDNEGNWVDSHEPTLGERMGLL